MIHKNFILYFTMLHFIWNISYPKILVFINDYKLFWRLLVYYYKLFSSRLKKASNFAALVCCTAPNEHNLMLKSNGNCSNLAQSEKKNFLTLQKHFLDLPTPLPQPPHHNPITPPPPPPPPKKKKKKIETKIFSNLAHSNKKFLSNMFFRYKQFLILTPNQFLCLKKKFLILYQKCFYSCSRKLNIQNKNNLF